VHTVRVTIMFLIYDYNILVLLLCMAGAIVLLLLFTVVYYIIITQYIKAAAYCNLM